MKDIELKYGFDAWKTSGGGYTVELPHSCDEWVITINTKTKAIEEMKTFIKEAQEALGKLKKLE